MTVTRSVSPSAEISWERGPPPAELLDALYVQWASYVMTIGLRILGSEEDARDVLQDVFLRLHRHRTSIYGPEVLKSWLRQTTVRRARRVLKRRRALRFIGVTTPFDPDELPCSGASPEQQALLGSVYVVLQDLPVDERIAWTLRHIQGEKLQDVADSLGCSLATAKRKIGRAQARLEEALR